MEKLILNRVKKVLKEQGRTQTWLAKQVGISQTAINAICRNKTQPSLKRLAMIAHFLGVTPGELMEWPVEGLIKT